MYRWPVPALMQRYRWLAEQYGPESPQAQAARGRMNAGLHRVPGLNDESPAAIAAHRALGRYGYLNRSARYHRRSVRPLLGTLAPNIST
jgi:hypothetical protein